MLESQNACSVRLLIGVLARRDLVCGCVPPYPLFIHSLLSQSLGNETGDGNEDLRGGSSLAPFILFCSSHLSLWICSSPLRHLHPSKALDHFKMSGPSLQMAETEEKYHRSYLGLQTMNPNCSWDEGLPRADRALLSLIKKKQSPTFKLCGNKNNTLKSKHHFFKLFSALANLSDLTNSLYSWFES